MLLATETPESCVTPWCLLRAVIGDMLSPAVQHPNPPKSTPLLYEIHPTNSRSKFSSLGSTDSWVCKTCSSHGDLGMAAGQLGVGRGVSPGATATVGDLSSRSTSASASTLAPRVAVASCTLVLVVGAALFSW